MLLFKLIFLLIGLYLHVFSFNPLAPPIGGAPSSKSALLGGNLFKIKIQNSARRKAFENQNSKFLCPGQTTICLIFVGCNQIMVIKEVCAIIALTIDRNNTPEIKYRRKKEIAAAQNPFPADQSSKFSPGRGNELEIERD